MATIQEVQIDRLGKQIAEQTVRMTEMSIVIEELSLRALREGVDIVGLVPQAFIEQKLREIEQERINAAPEMPETADDLLARMDDEVSLKANARPTVDRAKPEPTSRTGKGGKK